MRGSVCARASAPCRVEPDGAATTPSAAGLPRDSLLDGAIDRLHETIAADELAIKRFKKRKLQLKDAIIRFESALIPDEPA